MKTQEQILRHRREQAKYQKTHPVPYRFIRRWKRSFAGYFMGTWEKVRLRCQGKYWPKYAGLPHMTKDEWRKFLIETETVRRKLYDTYVKSGHDRKLAPSIDRIEPSKGYIVGNVQWLTVSQNALRSWDMRKGADK